jgi:hypothetical protein
VGTKALILATLGRVACTGQGRFELLHVEWFHAPILFPGHVSNPHQHFADGLRWIDVAAGL